MNNILIYGGAAFFGIMILIISFFVYKAIRERKNSTNLELPNLNEIDKEERLKRMEANREDFGFGEELQLSESQINDISDEEVQPEQYLGGHKETSVDEDFGGLLNSNGEITRPTPKIIKNKIDLPDIGLDSLDDTSTEAPQQKTTDDTNTSESNLTDETSSESVSSDSNFSLPSID